MKRITWLVSTALVLAACDSDGNPPKDLPPIDPEALTEPVIVAEFADPAQFAQASLTLSDGAKPYQYEGIVYKNYAYFVLKNLPNSKATYNISVDSFDQKGGIALFGKTFKHDFAKQRVVYIKDFKRLKSKVKVSASPILAKTNQLVAKLGQQTLPMKVENGVATAVFQDVETNSKLDVLIEGKDVAGAVTQTGKSTFKHGKAGSQVDVVLNAVVSCPQVDNLTTIPAVQGTGATSPVVGQSVTVNGVVTSDLQAGIGGFFIQDAQGDGNIETSDALFVYTGKQTKNVAVGDLVQLTGTVKEYKSRRDKKPDTATQIDTLTQFVKCGTVPQVKPVNVRAPFDFERYEGMLIRFADPLTVTNNYFYGRYGELGLSAGGRLFQPTNGNTNTTKPENEARLVGLNDGSNKQNPKTVPFLDGNNTRRTGDVVSGLTGILRYSNDAYKVEATVPPVFKSQNPRDGQPDKVGGNLTVASVNVLNYFTTFGDRGADNQYEFDRQKTKIVASLKKLDADILTLMEIQNNGDAAVNDLADALNKAYGSEVYKGLQTGKIGTDAIKVAMLYKPARVELFGKFATDNDSVYSRPPLAQGFRDLKTGGRLTVITSHFKSKGRCPKSGDVDQGQGCWNLLRTQQAQKLAAFAERMKTQNGDQDVLLTGDLNAYGAEDPIKALESAGYVDAMKRLPAAERYTYQFAGRFGYLDYALATKSLDQQLKGVTAWHINSDEPKLIDYNVEYKDNPNCPNGQDKCTSPDLYAPNLFRASDHDPVLVGLKLKKDEGNPQLSIEVTGAAEVKLGEVFNLGISSSAPLDKLSIDWGDGSQENLQPDAQSASHTYAQQGQYTIKVSGQKGDETATATKDITVKTISTPTKGKVVISQVYGGGGNSGAEYTNDFVEIFNSGNTNVNLADYSVQYASAQGTTWQLTPLTNVNLAPGQYYLVQQAKGNGGTKPLPTPDATGGINMSSKSGQVILAQKTSAVTGKDDVAVRDYVLFSGLSNTKSASRADQGCTDTDSNNDFSSGDVAPRNTITAKNPCS